MTEIARNQLYGAKFKLVFNELPNVEFYCRNAAIPDIAIDNIEVQNPLNTLNFPGNKLRYGDFNIQFKVDEDLRNYKELHNWMRNLASPQNFEQFKDHQKNFQRKNIGGLNGFEHATDSTLYTLTNVDQPNQKINFKNIYPMSIGSIDFALVSTDNTIECSATFKYDWFEII